MCTYIYCSNRYAVKLVVGQKRAILGWPPQEAGLPWKYGAQELPFCDARQRVACASVSSRGVSDIQTSNLSRNKMLLFKKHLTGMFKAHSVHVSWLWVPTSVVYQTMDMIVCLMAVCLDTYLRPVSLVKCTIFIFTSNAEIFLVSSPMFSSPWILEEYWLLRANPENRQLRDKNPRWATIKEGRNVLVNT